MVTSHYLMPLILSLSVKGRPAKSVAHIPLQMEALQALWRFMSLTDNGEYFQPKLLTAVPICSGGWLGWLQTWSRQSCAMLCSVCPQLCQWFSVSFWAITMTRHVPSRIRQLIQVSSLTSLTNEPNRSHSSADETHFDSQSASFSH